MGCIALFLEGTGLCSGAWVLAGIHKKISGFQRDEVYIGTAEERAAKNMGDDENVLHVGMGHAVKLPGFFDNAPKELQELMEKDASIHQYISSVIEEQTKKNMEDAGAGAEATS